MRIIILAIKIDQSRNLFLTRTFSLLGVTGQDSGKTESRTLHVDTCLAHSNSAALMSNLSNVLDVMGLRYSDEQARQLSVLCRLLPRALKSY